MHRRWMRCKYAGGHASHVRVRVLQVLERIKDPLKTLISRDDPAIAYAVLSHVLLIVLRAPIIFESVRTRIPCHWFWAECVQSRVLQMHHRVELMGCCES